MAGTIHVCVFIEMKFFRLQNRQKNTLYLLMACGVFILTFWQNVYACPGCNAIESGSVGHGFNLSVLFMIMMPFFVAGSAAFGVIFFIKNQNKNNAETKTTITHTKKEGS